PVWAPSSPNGPDPGQPGSTRAPTNRLLGSYVAGSGASPDYSKPLSQGCRPGASSALGTPIRPGAAPEAHRPLTPSGGRHSHGLSNGSARRMGNGNREGLVQALAHPQIPAEMRP